MTHCSMYAGIQAIGAVRLVGVGYARYVFKVNCVSGRVVEWFS